MAAQSGGDMQVDPEACPQPFAINPGKLHPATAPGASSAAQSKDTNGLKTMASSIMARPQAAAIPPVLKISSFWDPKRGHLSEDWERPCWKKECLAYDVVPNGWQTFYFSLSDSYPIRVPTDPAAFPPGLMVHLDRDSQSIYDAYLLKSDITNNLNEYRRLQLLYNQQMDKYVFVERFGRVGLVGHLSSPSGELAAYYCSNAMVDVFEIRFARLTGTKWEHRYVAEPVSVSQYPLRDRYIYVDQDYSRHQRVKLLNHEALTRMAGMHESTSLLMENILYGDGASKSSPCHNTVNAPSVGSFTAPFHCLSIRTIAQAFQTLKRIAFYLGSDDLPELDRNGNEKPRLLRWTTLVAASSCYRSQIPSWHGPDNSARPLVISNHYILFCELEFLHNLNPQNPPLGLQDFKNTVGHKGNPRAWAWGGVSRAPPPVAPLMQAYSSLPHGFYLLPDTGSTALEFRELKAYLENSCQTHEHRMQFEIEGIYRVYTKAKLENPYHGWLRKTRDDQLSAADSREPPRRNRLLLWHGTPLASLFGILEKGLQIYKRCPDPPPDPPNRQPAPTQAPGTRAAQLIMQRNAAIAARNAAPPAPSQPTTNAAPSAAAFQAQVQLQAQMHAQMQAQMQAQRQAPQRQAQIQAQQQQLQAALMQAQQQQLQAALAATALPAAPMTQANKRRRLHVLGNQPPPAPPPPQVNQLPAWMLQIPPQMPPRAPAINIPPGGSTMFGDGIYLADASSKSANYCTPQRNLRTGPNEVYAILLLCEADVGSPSERHRSRHSMPRGHEFVQKKREWEEDKRRRTEELKHVVYVDDAPTLGTLGNGVRSIQGVGKVGPRDGPEGWKKVPWRLDWDWTGHDGKHPRGEANDYGDVWMPDTSRPYPSSTDGYYSLQFNEYVLYDPSHVQIRYIFRVRVKRPY